MTAAETATLAIDAHGGDHGVAVTVPATVDALMADCRLSAVLVGREPDIEAALERCAAPPGERLHIEHAPEILPMDARAAAALRHGKGSSMWRSMELVADGAAGACVSGGSTGAMMVLGVRLIGMLPGIQRPALMGCVPHFGGHTSLLDLGANLRLTARQLVQFAVMGAVTAEAADGIAQPRVALLNVGHEDGKGYEELRDAHAALKETPLNYVGFAEGNELFTDDIDVAVCDGFTGNLILKAAEGLARMLTAELRRSLASSWRSRLGARLARPELARLLAPLDPSEHNGAPLLGLNRVVVKSHGGAECRAVTRAILEAGREARRDVPGKIEASIRAFQLETEA